MRPAYPFPTSHTYEPSDHPGEVNPEPSVTSPDMAYSVAEIMHRFATGREVSLNHNLAYTGDQPFPELHKMDAMDQQDLIRANADNIEKLKKQYSDDLDKAFAKKVDPPKKEADQSDS